MPRTRKVTDDQIFAAMFRAMQRVGPADLTLGAIAAEAGVTPGLLVQRFGSKRALQVLVATKAANQSRTWLRDLRQAHESPLETLRVYVRCFADLAATPEAFVRNLAYLMEDLSDPELRGHLARQSRATCREIEELLVDAIARRELVRTTDAKRLARTIEAVIGGSMLTWATYRIGKADRWMLKDLDAVLEPYLA